MVERLVQAANTLSSISVNPSGRTTSVKLSHSSKTESPILFTLAGIVMLERPVHSNANGPILFNPSGRATAIRFLHPPNVSVGISVTHSGTVK